GVGIDYSLLVVTRFREELNRGLSPVDAAVRTVETAGSAVITSGLTVVVGFAALLTTPLSDTRSVGVGGLFVVLVAVLLATTFLPAVLTDSIRKDPRVREVRGVASVRPHMSTLQLLFFYSDPAAARQKYAKFFDAYLSTDERTTLLDVIPADTVSLAGMMDVARHVRAV